jgi:hypothetical protein
MFLLLQFKTPSAAAETLFAVVNGDEIYATLAILESDKSGGNWVWWFSRLYLGAYVAIFTIVVINLLIALFMSAYESIKVCMAHNSLALYHFILFILKTTGRNQA